MARVIFSRLSVEELLTEAKTILTNAEAPGIVPERLAEYGWSSERLSELRAVLSDFAAAANHYLDVKATESTATSTFNESVDAFRRGPFRSHVTLVGAVFTGDVAVRNQLQLDDGLTTLSTHYDNWQPRAARFYQSVLSDASMQEALAEYNVSPEDLQQGADELDRLEALHSRRTDLSGERQQARQDRDAKREVLETELRRFQSFAEVALQDTPERLEGLGFTIPSGS
jgi:hypothetical protein